MMRPADLTLKSGDGLPCLKHVVIHFTHELFCLVVTREEKLHNRVRHHQDVHQRAPEPLIQNDALDGLQPLFLIFSIIKSSLAVLLANDYLLKVCPAEDFGRSVSCRERTEKGTL